MPDKKHPGYTLKTYYSYRQNVSVYEDLGKNNYFPIPETCPVCEKEGSCLIGHGFYKRWVITNTSSYRIVIKVWKCKKTRKYVSVHPTFLLPYKQYRLSLIYKILKLHILSGLSMKASLESVFSKTEIPSYQLIQNWIKNMLVSCGIWLGILQSLSGKCLVPQNNKSRYSRELIHLMLILEEYFKECKTSEEIEIMHGKLFNRYRGSPFSTFESR